MLEVMAFGVPVLGSAVFGVPELIHDGHTGLLFGPACLGELAAALDRFLALSVAERVEIGEAGRALVRATRPARYYGEAYSALIGRLVADPEALPAEVLAP
jgi:galacturonosyltransferase